MSRDRRPGEPAEAGAAGRRMLPMGGTRGRRKILDDIKVSTAPAATPAPPISVRDPVRDELLAAIEAGGAQLPADAVAAARAVLGRAHERARFGPASTVVAVAGATGSGKSSLVNALAGLQVAAVGVRRPTTSTVTACVWGQVDAELLDWLGVPARHRVERVSALDADTQAPLEGLVLLDLPDHDSTATHHREQVDRLIAQVDVLVWVADPQKYADAALHQGYLRHLRAHADLVLVVLNQIDTLDVPARVACLQDFSRLLDDDGLGRSPVLATSAVTGEGLDALTRELVGAVAAHTAAWRRSRADLSLAVDRLREGVAPAEPDPEQVEGSRELVEAMAVAAGVPALSDAVRASRHRAGALRTGWPFTRWVRRLRPDPVRRLHLGIARAAVPAGGLPGEALDPVGDGEAQAAALVSVQRTSLPAPGPAQRALVASASRRVAASAGSALPPRWSSAVRAAVTADDDSVADALDQAVASVPLPTRVPAWWRLVAGVQVALALASLVGFLWLAVLGLVAWLRLPPPGTPSVPAGGIGVPVPTVMLAGGIVGGIAVAALAGVAVRLGAQRAAEQVRRAAKHAVALVVHEKVLLTLDAVLERHRLTRMHLEAASRALERSRS